ncbi:uncharacterized protein LOC112588101 [Harpegnathos saltator]|uniref:uncharacterized protein LOC112588101 n=1 Tax=Harpegnathos saltator TaxID=610380 RepID=UPI000DBEF013|nr:uncharacterized protein LOC112588101 [Harpegnathos saltator]
MLKIILAHQFQAVVFGTIVLMFPLMIMSQESTFDVEAGIVESLSNVSLTFIPTQLQLDFNTDGCTLDRAGIYKGAHKPHDANIFFEKFVTDIRTILSNGGINFNGNKVPIQLKSFIADAPARAFVLNHVGHISSQPCSKCKVSGTQCERRNVFHGINHSLRNDDEYIRCVDEDHHKEGTSPLSLLPIEMERPKRIVGKPSRYETTSPGEVLKRTKIGTAKILNTNINTLTATEFFTIPV